MRPAAFWNGWGGSRPLVSVPIEPTSWLRPGGGRTLTGSCSETRGRASPTLRSSWHPSGSIGVRARSGCAKHPFPKTCERGREDEPKRGKKAAVREDLFNRWELVELSGGGETGLFNESVSDLKEMGTIAKIMLNRIPAIQISVDLSQAMILSYEIGRWAESK